MTARDLPLEDRVIVALDFPRLEEAEAVVKDLEGILRAFKIGLELFTAAGPQGIAAIRQGNRRLFLDLKLHDIPTTVARASRRAIELGADLFTCHALGGRAMMEAVASEAARARGEGLFPIALAVTVLTSLGEDDMVELLGSGRPDRWAVRWAGLARQSGIGGVVASGEEVEEIKGRWGDDLLVVVPGVRPRGSETADHQRSVTPREALRRGADFLVVGRPVTRARDPRAAARDLLEDALGA